MSLTPDRIHAIRLESGTRIRNGSATNADTDIYLLLAEVERLAVELDELQEVATERLKAAMRRAVRLDKVRAVAEAWERDEDAKGLHYDLIQTLDGAD